MDQRECARLETRDGQAVNLMGIQLSGDLRGLMFEASIEQRFCNPGSNSVEVVYSFPFPWGAVLLGVDVVLGDKHLTGAVVEKRQSTPKHAQAVRKIARTGYDGCEFRCKLGRFTKPLGKLLHTSFSVSH